MAVARTKADAHAYYVDIALNGPDNRKIVVEIRTMIEDMILAGDDEEIQEMHNCVAGYRSNPRCLFFDGAEEIVESID